MNRAEFAEATGASIRQLDYWATHGIPLTTDNKTKIGSGYHRDYDSTAVPKVQLLVTLSKVFEGRFSVYTLKRIFDEYHLGQMTIQKGLFLKWDVETIERNE